MGAIQMVNLQAQYKRFQSEINDAFERVCNSGTFIKGGEVAAFEQELAQKLNVKHVIGVANGTDALQIALMALDLSPGDEVIMPAFAYAALPEAVLLLGLKPVFVDVSELDFLINPDLIIAKITSKTRVIAPVHLFGLTANMDVLGEIAERHGLFLLEDAAQSMGSLFCGERCYGSSGALGHIGTTSFFPSKNLGCYGDGGAIFTNDDTLAEKARIIANHGQTKKYYHEIIGLNSRLDALQAAILRVKLPHLDTFIFRRNQVAKLYNESFSQISQFKLPTLKSGNSTHACHQYTLIIRDGSRDKLAEYLSQKGIPSMIYYPIPLHQQKAYATFEKFTVSEQLCKEVISLPICPELTNEEQLEIINNIKSFYKS